MISHWDTKDNKVDAYIDGIVAVVNDTTNSIGRAFAAREICPEKIWLRMLEVS